MSRFLTTRKTCVFSWWNFWAESLRDGKGLHLQERRWPSLGCRTWNRKEDHGIPDWLLIDVLLNRIYLYLLDMHKCTIYTVLYQKKNLQYKSDVICCSGIKTSVKRRSPFHLFLEHEKGKVCPIMNKNDSNWMRTVLKLKKDLGFLSPKLFVSPKFVPVFAALSTRTWNAGHTSGLQKKRWFSRVKIRASGGVHSLEPYLFLWPVFCDANFKANWVISHFAIWKPKQLTIKNRFGARCLAAKLLETLKRLGCVGLLGILVKMKKMMALSPKSGFQNKSPKPRSGVPGLPQPAAGAPPNGLI